MKPSPLLYSPASSACEIKVYLTLEPALILKLVSIPAHIHRTAGGGIYTCTITGIKEMAATAQAVPRQFKVTFAYTHLHQVE
jgi:hypothetical protein